MAADVLIRGARVVDPANAFDRPADVYVRDGYLLDLAPPQEVFPAREVIEAEGLVLCPGLLDAHVHLRQPGGERKETVASGTRAALAGGFTGVCAMPNTTPPVDRPNRLAELQEVVARDAACRVYPLAAAVLDGDPERLSDFAAVKAAGAVAVTDDAMPLQDPEVMLRALIKAEAAGLPLVVHPELDSAAPAGVLSDPAVADRLGVAVMSPAREEAGLAVWLEAVARARREMATALHCAHLSSAGAIEAFRALTRQARLARVTAETCPHYFTLTSQAAAEAGADAKMNPPLRRAQDVDAVREALADGTLQVIATDHAPHTPEEKALGLARAPFGIVGLETAVGLTLTFLVHAGLLSLSDAIARLTVGPARALGLPGGRLDMGAPADLTLLDLESTWRVEPERFYSRSRNTPFRGWELRGRAVMVFVGGRLAMAEGEVLI